MPFHKSIVVAASIFACASITHAQIIEKQEIESGSLLPGYTGVVDSPFTGVAAYANNDGAELMATFVDVPGKFQIDIRGASSNNSGAGISIYLDDKKLGAVSFSSTSPTVESISFNLESYPSQSNLKFILETDNGSNDTFLDWYELQRVGDIPAPPPALTLPSTGAYESGEYRNLFAELGYSQAEVQARVNSVYDQLFHSTDTANEALFIPVGSDMAYIWDVGNNDVRSEGMSYGMMMAVQMGRQDDFNKLWKWAHTYSLNKTGDMKGYFAWKVSTSGNVQDAAPAPDGEEYFATALFFASHRWGDGSGIYDYKAMANQILDDMFSNGQTRYNNEGVLENFSLFNHDEKQIVFSPATPSDRNWTDPSYHLPAFYELWARWADNNNSFWNEIADTSRNFFKTTVNPQTGLSPDYAYFDGTPHGDFQHWKDTFQYDAWRTVSNAAMDFAWWKKDNWQTTYVTTLQSFLKSEGIDSYSSLYELNGVPYENNSDHSPGLVAMNAVASLASDNSDAWSFVQALWDTPVPEGQWRYYDGSLYMFGMLAASGNYRIYCPAGECDSVAPPTCEELGTCGDSNTAPVAANDSVTTEQNTSVIINALQNDSDADGDSLSIANYSNGVNGTVSKNGTQFTYTPNTNFTGTDTFSYTITDGELTDTATVNITVTSTDVPDGGTGLLEQVELETGTLYPSYRQPISNPFSGIILYGNNESVSVNTSKLSAGSYELIIYGASSNNSAAGISVYADDIKIGTASFSSTSRSEQSISFNLSQSASTLKFVLETDTGQNDTLLNWYKLYGSEGSDTPEETTCSAVTVQAEDYTSYYDTTSGNSGNAYRSDNVDLQGTSDIGGGYNVGWTANNEWLEYDLTLEDCSYTVEVRVASNPGGGQYSIELNGSEIVSPTSVSSTGAWQNWTTQTHSTVTSNSGPKTLRFNILSGNFNVNWIKFIPVK